jgi:myo-inositol 2-dehydrogenase/D-chiro-inositol 1-dehydrogenase
MVPEAKLKAISDVRGKALTKDAKKFKAKVYKDYHEVLMMKDVDVIDICTPTDTHPRVAVDAAKAGKNILLEKPIALSLKEADRIIKATEKAGVTFMVAHCMRFFSEYVKCKELVDNGVLGEPVIARALRAGPLPVWGVKSWFKDQKRSGGCAVDLAIHDIDFIRWCYNEDVVRVYAKVGRFVRKDATMDDHALMILRFTGGGVAHIEASWAVPQQYPFTYFFELSGTKGFVTFNNHEPVPLTVMSKGKTVEYSPDTKKWVEGMPFPIDPYYREIRHFADCVLKGETPLTGGIEARKALEIGLAARLSSKRGEPIKLPLEA